MVNKPKIVVPALQVLLAVATLVWYNIGTKMFSGSDFWRWYAVIPRDIVMKLNFPVVVVWSPIFYALNETASRSYLKVPVGAVAVFVSVLVLLLILSTVALFWYFVVLEVERRRQGSSLMRFKNRMLELVKVGVMFAAAGGCVLYGYSEGNRMLVLGRATRVMSLEFGAVVGGVLLVSWAILLANFAVQDCAIVLRTRPVSSPVPRP